MLDSELSEFLLNFTLKKNIDYYLKDSYKTNPEFLEINGQKFNKYINEFWTSKQRQSSSIHEISYRACFKAELPRFFIKLLSKTSDMIYDPFSGRGTTVIEAALLKRNVISNDINPLSEILSKPRLFIPKIVEVEDRLKKIPLDLEIDKDIDLSMFYHLNTEQEIRSLRKYLNEKKSDGNEDSIDKWIRMVATNRLTGHSKGFFSVYTLPPNQAVSQERQIKINKQKKQKPEYRDVKKLILKKTESLYRNLKSKDIEKLHSAGKNALFLTKDVRETSEIKGDTVQLIVTSPPFLKVVQYSKDNWLRCWFNSIDPEEISKKITLLSDVNKWSEFIGRAFKEFYRIIKKNGWVAFEVGEVRKGTVNLEEYIVPVGIETGFSCKGILINKQDFTKTSNIWGIKNKESGTNTNRIVLFRKEV